MATIKIDIEYRCPECQSLETNRVTVENIDGEMIEERECNICNCEFEVTWTYKETKWDGSHIRLG